MSIVDVDFLKENSVKQSYNFLIDSTDRDRSLYPNPNNYTIEFDIPFKNVIGLELIDVSIPRTMYSIDINNNSLFFYIGTSTDNLILNGLNEKNINGKIFPDTSLFQEFKAETGDYTLQTFIPKFNTNMKNINVDLQIRAVSNPAELKNIIMFTSSNPFILDMNNSTIAETLGFDLYTQKDELDKPEENKRYTFIEKYELNNNFRKIYHSVYNTTLGLHIIEGPGCIYLLGNRYILLRCPEIEEHAFRSLSYTKQSLGIAKLRIGSFGYNDERVDITKVALREFHPIGKLPKLTFRFETYKGSLYDFKGVNHNLLFTIYYYEPTSKIKFNKSILNPNYQGNFIDYLYNEADQQVDLTEEGEDFSIDNIEQYKKKEKILLEHYINNKDMYFDD